MSFIEILVLVAVFALVAGCALNVITKHSSGATQAIAVPIVGALLLIVLLVQFVPGLRMWP